MQAPAFVRRRHRFYVSSMKNMSYPLFVSILPIPLQKHYVSSRPAYTSCIRVTGTFTGNKIRVACSFNQEQDPVVSAWVNIGPLIMISGPIGRHPNVLAAIAPASLRNNRG